MKVILISSPSSSNKCVHLSKLLIFKKKTSRDVAVNEKSKKANKKRRKSEKDEKKIEYFITQKMLIPPIDT